MALVHLENVEKDRWYNISLFADRCKANGRTLEPFEAKFNGQWWVDKNGRSYRPEGIIFIDDELAF